MSSISSNVTGANAGRARSLNRRIVLGQVRNATRLGRADIARATGLTIQAVSNIIAELEQDDLLVEDGRRASRRGLPAVLYALNPNGGFSIGVEIRPDALFVSILNLTGEEIQGHHEVLQSTAPQVIVDRILRARDAMLDNARVSESRLLGVGVVLPGPFGKTGLSLSAAELPDWQDLDVAALISERLGLQVIVENDANAAAMSERVSGVAKDLHSFAYLYFGAGLGLGLIEAGKLVRGAHGNAGEIGHIPVAGGQGCVLLEQTVSRLSVQTWLAAHGIPAASGEDLQRLFHDRNPHIEQWLDRAARSLSPAIATIENMFDPQSIVLGGALPDALLDRLIELVPLPDASVANRPDRTVPRLMRGGYGRMTAARGAAALVIDRSFLPQIEVEAQGNRPCR